jgi:hypothetical protein
MTKRGVLPVLLAVTLMAISGRMASSSVQMIGLQTREATSIPILNGQAEGTYRGLWIWQTDIILDSDAQQAFLTFAQHQGIRDAYLNGYDLLPDRASELENFIIEADMIDIEVELLSGEPHWALTSNHALALDFAQRAITFTQAITGEARPAGLHLDVEPYLLSQWQTDQANTITQYLNLLSEVKQKLTAFNSGLRLTVDIPFWFDTITATYQSKTKPLHQHVQDIADRVVIMDYRDVAEGADGIIIHAQNEIDYGESITKEVIIGVETNDAAPEPEKVTFFEEGEAVMEQELALVAQHYQSSPAFGGFAIHDYSGYRTLVFNRKIYLPLSLNRSDLPAELFACRFKATDNKAYQNRLNKEQQVMVDDSRIITFAGHEWIVKTGSNRGPGPNTWSDNEESVWVDQLGRLHLRIREENGIWYSAEVYTKICTTYGLHRFDIIGRLDKLDPHVVFAPFLYKDDETEIDIEFTRWGQPYHLDNVDNGQYVVQPWHHSGNLIRFPLTLSGDASTHIIDWQSDIIRFKSVQGHDMALSTPMDLINTWDYAGANIPYEAEELRVHINLWLYEGKPPLNNQEVEVIVKAVALPVP